MAGRLYRMAKVVSANPSSWGIVDANQISGFRTVATKADLYSIAACILSSSYGDGVTNGADAVGQIWHVQENNKDYKLIDWSTRSTSAGWTEELTPTELVGKINAAENKADSAINKANTNAATITTLSEKVAANASAIDKKADTTTVTNLSSTVSGINNTVTNHANAIANLKKQVDSTNKSLTSVTEDFTNFKALKGQHNGLATLDANGNVPLTQLGNLDMTVFTVVESLPTSNIENKVYLVRSSLTSDKNNYIEYIYTGDRKGTYDATKWEKLGEVAAKTDLTNYYKKNETYSASQVNTKVTALNNADIKQITSAIEVDKDDEKGGTNSLHIKLTRNDTTKVLDLKLPNATNENSGIMPKGYISRIDDAYVKLNGIEAGANKTVVDAKFSTTSTNPVQNKVIATWVNNTSAAVTANTNKLKGIQEHANNYVHPGRNANASGDDGFYKITVDGFGHVSKTTAVTKKDIIDLGIIDDAMSSTSVNAVQNKVINNAIVNHKINSNNLGGIADITYGGTKLLFYNGNDDAVSYNDDNSACYLISGSTTHGGKNIPKLYYSEDGTQLTSQLLRDIDVVALSETDVNNILNAAI